MKPIFDTLNVKDFLRGYIDGLPRKGWGEVQSWAEHLGVQGSYISQILSGNKTLNVDQALKLASVLGLQGIEKDCFIFMVEKEKAGSHETKNYFDEKIKNLKGQSKNLSQRLPQDKTLSAEQKSIFYSSWIYSGVRMLCSLPGGQTFQQLSQKLDLSKEALAPILNFLCEAGLCVKKAQYYHVGGRKTHLEIDSPHVRKHWLNWHLKALQRFENVQPEELIYSAPFTISQKDFEYLREELAQFIQKFVSKVEKTEPEKMAVLNINLLKLI